MPALNYQEEQEATGDKQEVLNKVKEQFGLSTVPNTFKAMAHKPAFLNALLDMDKAVFDEGALDSKSKHLMAVAVSAVAGCEYCLHAHAAIAEQMGASEEEVAEAMSVAAVMGAYNNFNKALGMENDITPE